MVTKKVQMLAGFWDISLGEHPSAIDDADLYSFTPAYTDESIPEHLEEFELPLIPCQNGHNLVADDTIHALCDIDYLTPISPLFARDLCGRIIYLGYGPEEKEADQWMTDRRVTFPHNCRLVTQDIPGSDLIENVFFTRFRTLDMCTDYDVASKKAGDPKYAGSYNAVNLYPYKLRLDTFYQDGWRLPQTNMVYAKSRGITPSEADETARSFMNHWQNRPEKQSYEDFYESNGGESWFEDLFSKGCTVIPTLEACNGFNKVNTNFEVTDYHNGRAVEGLHDIDSHIDSNEPKGTILKVLEPGYVLQHKVLPARVVVSNGARYKEETQGAPHPLLPDLRLPHQRTSAEWGATWLPTHPAHFEEPAIWGWDQQTGRFLQLSGPIWDPLHYYYESVDMVVRAHKLPLNENKHLSPVPTEMKNRFYPIVPMKGFDVFSLKTKEWREENGILPQSGITRIPTQQPTCTTGYHPLPLQFEYEIDSWWFPYLAPKARVEDTDNPEITLRRAEVIECEVTPHQYLDAIQEDAEIERLTRPNMLTLSERDPYKDYPQINRYVAKHEADKSELHKNIPIHIGIIDSLKLYQEQTDLEHEIETISKETGISYYSALLKFHNKARERLRLRNKAFGKYPEFYAAASWDCLPVDVIQDILKHR